MEDRKEILNSFYTENCDEDSRLLSQHGKVEFITTTTYIEKYLTKDSKILEVGAGTGRYSLYYASRGYDVTALEYVEHNLDILKNNIKDGMKIKAEQGDAVDLSRYEDNTFDVTLVLGSLYHLYSNEDQDKAISEAIRVTKRDGIVAIAYLTSDSIAIDWIFGGKHILDGSLGKDYDENFKMINYPGGIFAAFYIDEFLEKMKSYNITLEKNIATDGMARHIKDKIDNLSEVEFKKFIEYHLLACERYELQGYSNHMLYIGRKN